MVAARYADRSALRIFKRDARTAGRNPPTMPISNANRSVETMTDGARVNPNASSEKVPKLVVEIRTKDISDARAIPIGAADDGEENRLYQECPQDAAAFEPEGAHRADFHASGWPLLRTS